MATQTNERLPSSAAAPSPPPARPQTADPAAASAAARSYSIIAPGRTASSSAYPRPATAKERTPPWSRDTQPGDAPRPPLAAAFRPGGKRTQGLGGGGQPQSVRGGGGPGGATARASTADGERLAGTSRLSFESDRGSRIETARTVLDSHVVGRCLCCVIILSSSCHQHVSCMTLRHLSQFRNQVEDLNYTTCPQQKARSHYVGVHVCALDRLTRLVAHLALRVCAFVGLRSADAAAGEPRKGPRSVGCGC